ncbi:PREDICTED: uncharacterized protein LOC109207159 [Nicotiana attenuata]|uniref:uncharacterized protein LOC109207159 n=1 Tax=Nicotiana attenuata TaxID=49451 RepID=UPI000904DC69|nr:PREDICTED: uncharacterized protein LOC109207159 [Nicotiana attenuata]
MQHPCLEDHWVTILGQSIIKDCQVYTSTHSSKQLRIEARLASNYPNNCIFRGKVNEDSNTHLMEFEEIMNTFQYNGVSKDAVYFREFPFSLKDDANQQLRSLHTGTIKTWEDMTKKILDKYFSAAKTGKLRKEIHNFYQKTKNGFRSLGKIQGDSQKWPAESNDRRKSIGIRQVDSNTSMQAQLDTMAKEIRKLTLAKVQSEPQTACDFCGLRYPTHGCQASAEEVNAVGNLIEETTKVGTTIMLWVKDIQQNNLRPQGQGPPGFQNQQRQQYQPQQSNQSNMEDLMKIANLLSERAPGSLPSDIEKNPKETIKVVSLRSGKTLADPMVKARPEVVNKQAETLEEKNSEEQKGQSSGLQKEIEESRHMPALPFPQATLYEHSVHRGTHSDACLCKVLEEILSSKRKLEETTVVKLNAHCSAILQNKIPQKCRDRRSFPIPCSLGNEKFDKALCDSGVSINVMPLSVFRKLEGELGVIKSIPSSIVKDEDPEIKKEAEALETKDQVVDKEELKEEASKPNVELKVLSTYLKYAFLETNNFPVIISAYLTGTQDQKLVELLKKHRRPLAGI